MNEVAHAPVWPTVQSIPVSAVTDDRPPGHLRPPRLDEVAGTTGTGRDTAGGAKADTPAEGAATGVGTAGARRATGARENPAADLGFSGDPGQHGVPGDDMLHAQRIWDGTLATNRMDALGVDAERRRVETKDVTASVGLLVDGWPQDVRACVQSLIDHTDATILALDLGNVDGAGDVLRELVERHPERIRRWHVAEAPHWRGGTATWGAARAKLLQLDTSEVHVLMETTLVLEGDALTPLVAAVKEGAVAAGWKGLEAPDAEAPEDVSRWRPAGPGRVRALRGDLMAVRRAAALTAFPKEARYGDHADLELSLALRGELVVPVAHVPVRMRREHEVAPEYRELEAKRNYDRVLHMLQPS
ncbi:hypothetical protein [Nonomuraea sp. LPB2021202275-12-8]|uniref:hypothetical protein n=1 Tax=Nonomuraea sp. LPB2021202275-12-8 TaxID=3120159 RepID=UPI00300D15FF